MLLLRRQLEQLLLRPRLVQRQQPAFQHEGELGLPLRFASSSDTVNSWVYSQHRGIKGSIPLVAICSLKTPVFGPVFRRVGRTALVRVRPQEGFVGKIQTHF
nr:MAG TPA: hypothetical protein [Caudoviricetes sp.]DAM41900.1 MAG TPA: hypothetical protein [Caudoviricetes sp.]